MSEASKTASGAMSKATTLEQTANSLSSTITAQGKTLEATTKTANTAKATGRLEHDRHQSGEKHGCTAR